MKRGREDIEGLQLIDNFLTEDEEVELMRLIDASPWDRSISRRTQHYGFRYDYTAKTAQDPAPPIPDWCVFVVDRLIERRLLKERPDQLIINEYTPGQGIAGHVDNTKYFKDGIVSISLNAEYDMDFTRGDEFVKLILPRRSALVLHGDARYQWRHGIEKRKAGRGRRVSLTFRKLI